MVGSPSPTRYILGQRSSYRMGGEGERHGHRGSDRGHGVCLLFGHSGDSGLREHLCLKAKSRARFQKNLGSSERTVISTRSRPTSDVFSLGAVLFFCTARVGLSSMAFRMFILPHFMQLKYTPHLPWRRSRYDPHAHLNSARASCL